MKPHPRCKNIHYRFSQNYRKTEVTLLSICFMHNIILREVKKTFHLHTHMKTAKEINLLRRQHTQFEKKIKSLVKERKGNPMFNPKSWRFFKR